MREPSPVASAFAGCFSEASYQDGTGRYSKLGRRSLSADGCSASVRCLQRLGERGPGQALPGDGGAGPRSWPDPAEAGPSCPQPRLRGLSPCRVGTCSAHQARGVGCFWARFHCRLPACGPKPPRSWVVRLWEAFLLQMNDFDRFLEQELRQMLDPVVAAVPPARGERLRRPPEPGLTLEVRAEPAPATIASVPQL